MNVNNRICDQIEHYVAGVITAVSSGQVTSRSVEALADEFPHVSVLGPLC